MTVRVITADELERQRFCTVKEAAQYLGRYPQHVYDLARRQKIATVYQGGRRMVVVKSLVQYADGFSIDPPEATP